MHTHACHATLTLRGAMDHYHVPNAVARAPVHAGGAIATLYCAEVWLDANLQAQTEVSNLTLAPQHAGAPGGVVRVYGDAAPAATVPYSILFANNSAMLGGALFTQGTTDLKSFYGLQGLQQDVEGPPSDDVLRQGWTVQDYYDSDNITRYIISPSNALARLPVIVFYNNTANGGGAIYIDGADQVGVAVAVAGEREGGWIGLASLGGTRSQQVQVETGGTITRA